MTKLLKYLFAIAAVAVFAACGDDSEFYYTTSYPVVRVEASVTVEAEAEPEPDEGEESGETGGETGNETGNETGGETGGETGADETAGAETGSNGVTSGETTDPMIGQIEREVLAAAPVQAGGGYTLDFKYFSTGRLTVRTTDGSEPIRGGFRKIPGSTDLAFFFGDNAYSCAVSTYAMNDGTAATLLTVDLTAAYQALYPDAKITQVLRLEYTAHRE